MTTNDQTLARLIAHLGGMLDQQRKAIEVLEAAISPQPAQGRLLGRFSQGIELWDLIAAMRSADPPLDCIDTLHDNHVHERLSDAILTFNTFWRMRAIKPDWSIAQYNAVLTLALGPDAPQFVASGVGWELRTNDV